MISNTATASSLPPPPAPSAPARCYAFGPFVIEVIRGRLWKNGVPVYVRPKDIEILSLLIEARDRVVEKTEIFSRVWPGVVVEDNNIARRISELRRVLGEEAGQRTYVVTHPGRGYRFVATAVELNEPPADAREQAPAHPISLTPPTVAPPATWRRRTSATTTLMVGMIAAVAVFVARYSPVTVAGPVSTRQLTFGADVQQEPAWSPDGRRLAYVGISEDRPAVFIQDLELDQTFRLTPAVAAAGSPTWSPDGRWIAYRTERDGGGIWIASDTGNDHRVLTRGGLHPKWSPDGAWILYAAGDGQDLTAWPHVVRPNGEGARAIFTEILSGSQQKYSGWHPDGRLSTWFRDANGRWRLATGSVATGQITESEIPPETRTAFTHAGVPLDAIEFPFSRLEQFVWAPDGTALYFEAVVAGVRAVWRVGVDRRSLAWKGRPVPVTAGAGNHAQIAISRDGTTLAFAAQADRTRIWGFPLDAAGLLGAGAEPVTRGRDVEVYVRSSLDGRTMLYRAVQGSRLETRVRDQGSDRALVNGVDRSNPVLSPDGKTVAFVRFGPAGDQYYARAHVAVMDTREGHERTLFYSPDLSFAPSDWSRDGTALVGKCGPTWKAAHRLCTMRLRSAARDSEAVEVTEIAGPRSGSTRLRRPSFSPDGRWVAVAEMDVLASDKSRLLVIAASGGESIALASGNSINDGPRWSSDGRLVYFISNRSGTFNVWAQRFDPALGRVVGSPMQVTRFNGAESLPYTVDTSIDVVGNRLLVPIAERTSHVWALFGLQPPSN